MTFVLYLNDPERPFTIPDDYLVQAYGLTATECAIAQALLNGCSIADIARQRNTTKGSARWQTKCLLQKTHTNSQAELIRLLAALSLDVQHI